MTTSLTPVTDKSTIHHLMTTCNLNRYEGNWSADSCRDHMLILAIYQPDSQSSFIYSCSLFLSAVLAPSNKDTKIWDAGIGTKDAFQPRVSTLNPRLNPLLSNAFALKPFLKHNPQNDGFWCLQSVTYRGSKASYACHMRGFPNATRVSGGFR